MMFINEKPYIVMVCHVVSFYSSVFRIILLFANVLQRFEHIIVDLNNNEATTLLLVVQIHRWRDNKIQKWEQAHGETYIDV